jgi:hypothetical protein
MDMSKKNKNHVDTRTPEQKAADMKEYKKTQKIVWIGAVVLIIILLVVSMRNIVGGYYYAFVLRSETITSAMEGIDAKVYTTAEEEELAELQSQWDSYHNSRLRDTVTTTASDGVTLGGYYYDNGSETTVIALRGYDQTADEDFLYAPYFEDCNLLLPDSRNHGISGGTASTFGVLEQNDLAAWLDWVEENLGQQNIVVYGEDVGAVTALMADENGLLEGRVSFVVAESPYTSLTDWAEYSMKQWFKIPKVVTKLMGYYSDLQEDFDYREADALAEASAGSVPVLFLVGKNNEFVPAEESTAVYDAWSGEKELCSYASRNGLIYAENTQEIQNVLDRWMETYLAG